MEGPPLFLDTYLAAAEQTGLSLKPRGGVRPLDTSEKFLTLEGWFCLRVYSRAVKKPRMRGYADVVEMAVA